MTFQRAGKVAVLLVTGYLLLCLLLRWGQTRLMFFPSAQIKATPAAAQLSYQEVWLPVSRGQVQGWWIPASSSTAPVVLYLHGNGSNLGDLVNRAARLHDLGAAVFLIDYRGYGRSWGVFPSEASVYEDAEAAWQYLTQTRQSPQKIVLYGESIGGAVAIEMASRHPNAAGVIVESSFTSMRAMVSRSLPEFLLPIDWILTQRFDSLTKVRSLQVPILLIHGTDDETIPATMGQALFAVAPEPKRLVLIPGADHDNVPRIGGALYLKEVEAFIQQVTE